MEGRPYSDGWDDDSEVDELSLLNEGDQSESAVVAASQPPAPAPAARAGDEKPASTAASAARAAFVPNFTPELPFFPRYDRPGHFPTFFARSGLFAAERGLGKRTDENRTSILGQDDFKATLSGPALTMGDKLVFEAIVEIAKRERLRLHEPLRCSTAGIAKQMGVSDERGGTSRHIWAALQRFAKTSLAFDLGDGVPRSGRLLASAKKVGSHGLELLFDPGFALPAFGSKNYRFDRERREKLNSPLAKWLHDFVSTHSKPRAIDLKYLRARAGFTGRSKDFAERLRKAAENIMENAPELLEMVQLDTSTRSSSKWTVTFYRGAEKAGYVE